MSNTTLKRLEQALERLLKGTPERTTPDGKVNLLRINDEAGLSNSGIYYYGNFVKEAKKRIAQHKLDSNKLKSDKIFEEELSELDKVKEKLKIALRLKKQYLQEKNDQKAINDGIVTQNVSLAFRVRELENEIRLIKTGKVIKI